VRKGTYIRPAATMEPLTQHQNIRKTAPDCHSLLILSSMHIYPRNLKWLELDIKLQSIWIFLFYQVEIIRT
jgi:hypothetical protein